MKTKHTAPCPFPATLPNGKTVVDEKCLCGHKRSEHADNGPAYGHGPCFGSHRHLRCMRFTWTEMIFAPKNTRPLRSRRVGGES